MNTNTEVLRVMKAGFAGVNKRIDKLEEEIGGIKTDISGLKADVSGLKADVSELKKDMSGVKKDIAGIKGDIAGLKDDFEKTAQTSQQQFLILQEKIDNITPKKEPAVGRLKTKAAVS